MENGFYWARHNDSKDDSWTIVEIYYDTAIDKQYVLFLGLDEDKSLEGFLNLYQLGPRIIPWQK